MHVREAEERDVEAIVLLRERVATEGRWIAEVTPEDRPEGQRLYLDRIRRPHSTVLVTESEEAIDGVIAIDLVGGIAALGMFVDSASRGFGKGTSLLAAAIGWARSQSAHKVGLDVWPHNEPAISLYRRAGFVTEGRRRRHYRRRNGELWDVVHMGLVLDHASPGSSFDPSDHNVITDDLHASNNTGDRRS
ncbi:GNAT family N-acetyltransferase [Actinopolymorpha rutila]|uniref:Ribosomal protein S18 acetylase RimI-like enzyme n=1 Tax=Actinopolymorpha rutila TaxID=446787 RepID=A0A852ZMQ5_9ACTN|nr:GNAT family N-acetyltransferase [Actinopolymorpha rutila]NYH93573.1 ribosomal protein S18 acetylase RimI-like enzyme [Actinopolymorpha rutila]